MTFYVFIKISLYLTAYSSSGMKIFRGFYILLLVLLIGGPGSAQIKGIGLPFIVNHPRSNYDAGTQNWSVTQSERGFLYFGNNDGILEFDGTGWETYRMPNASVVRSVMAVGDTIYAGAFEEIGFLAPDEKGELVWNSLTHLIPEEYKNFDEVWSIFYDQGRVIFQSFLGVFILEDGEIEVIQPSGQFGFMYEVKDNYYVIDLERGLMQLENGSLSLVSNNPLFRQEDVTCIIPHNNSSLLVGISGEGFFLLDDQGMKPWGGAINGNLQQYDPYAGIRLTSGNYAFGTISNGVFITDQQGNLVQHLNRNKGLQTNTVLALFEDQRKNLWLGMDNGIDYVEISSALTKFDYNFNVESTYATVLYDDILYVGTNQGLYAQRKDELRNKYGEETEFRLIEGTKGQVWSLEVIDNTLLCGHNQGSFQIEGFRARQISDIRGFWSFMELPEHDDMALAGTFTGLARLQNRNGNWHLLDEVEGFRESSRDLFYDQHGYLWVSHGYRGLFRLDPSGDFSRIEEVRLFYDEAGLPGDLPYHIHAINGEMVVSTHEGIMQYDRSADAFLPHPFLQELFENKEFVDHMKQDDNGNIWYYTLDYMGLMRRLYDGTFRDIVVPFARISDILMPAFENLFVADDANAYIGSQHGLIHYDPTVINDYFTIEEVYFTGISFFGNKERDTFFLDGPGIKNNQNNPPELPFALNAVTFEFTIPMYEDPASTMFSNRLKGFDETWSEWDEHNFRDYTNLREGDYVFEIKARTALGIESEVSAFHFSIAPPLWRSTAAYIVYVTLLLLAIAATVYFIRRRMLRIRQREKIRQEKKLAHKEKLFEAQTALSEKEIMHLRNESLKQEMQHKNKELANITMHLIQKNKMLTGLKNELSKLLKEYPSDSPERQQVNNLMKKVNRDLQNEKHWSLFNSYFDEVHQDFLNRLKEKYPDLSPKELRLCAYLRMNLSTKEIAPLMNISVRGVEISRYRLRKKLNLASNTNLTDFILSY